MHTVRPMEQNITDRKGTFALKYLTKSTPKSRTKFYLY